MKVGEVIAVIRQAKGFSQVGLSRRMGRSHVYISTIENKENPGLASITQVCTALGVDLVYVLTMADECQSPLEVLKFLKNAEISLAEGVAKAAERHRGRAAKAGRS